MSIAYLPSIRQPRPFETYLEVLRGVAALIVVLRHAILFPQLLQHHYVIAGPWAYIPPGHLSVLIFFTLSGFVIGLTNQRPLNTLASVEQYLAKRVIRLYPIYLLSIIITLAVASCAYNQWYKPSIVTYHLAFLQVLSGPVFKENPALWSLNYEIGYYLLFVVISMFNIRPMLVIAVSLTLAITATVGPSWLNSILPSYAYGLIMWLVGLVLARQSPSSSFDSRRWFGYMLSYLFLFLSFERMNLLETLAKAVRFNVLLTQVANEHQQIIHFSDLAFLPFCIVGISLFTNRSSYYYIWLNRLLYLTPLLYLLAYVASGRALLPASTPPSVATLFYLLSLVTYFAAARCNTLARRALAALTPLGSISYGIYVVHFPILLLIGANNTFNDGIITYLVRLLGYLVLTLLIGYILELRVQPYCRRLLTNWFIRPQHS
jgi:peptidoglycan/LPS O-acetylase OafA/YrhL